MATPATACEEELVAAAGFWGFLDLAPCPAACFGCFCCVCGDGGDGAGCCCCCCCWSCCSFWAESPSGCLTAPSFSLLLSCCCGCCCFFFFPESSRCMKPIFSFFCLAGLPDEEEEPAP